MPKALQHEYPRWEGDAFDPTQDVYAWPGAPRFVSAKRARKLRKRGVPLMPCHRVHDRSGEHRPGEFYPTHGDRARYCWFERDVDADNRKARKGSQCYQTWLEAERGLRGRKADLQERLEFQREDMQARAYFRKGAKLAATLFFQTNTTYGLPDVHVANPQIDVYAAAFRAMFEGKLDLQLEPQTATGEALDKIAALHALPAHWTNEQRRQYIRDGYVVEVGKHDVAYTERGGVEWHTSADGQHQWAYKNSPPVTVYVPAAFGDMPLQGYEADKPFVVEPKLTHDGPPFDGVRYAKFPRCASCNGVGCAVCGWQPGEGLTG